MFWSLFLIYISIGAILIIESYSKWQKLSKGTYIDDEIVIKRRHYRKIAVWGLLVIIAAIRFIVYHELWNTHFLPNTLMLIMVGIAFGYFRCFVEPYYNASLANDIEHLCLYLRPFETDKKNILNNSKLYAKRGWGIPVKIERLLCEELNRSVVQTFAIGNPNSNIPTTFATTNLYANDKEWKETIAILAEKASIIIIRIGQTEGCLWEIDHCIESELLVKVIFLVENAQAMKLLQEKLTNKAPQMCDALTEGHYALFLNEDGSEWTSTRIEAASDVKKCVDSYIDKHSSLRTEIQQWNKRSGKISHLFHIKDVPALWWQILAFSTNIFSYCFLNKWPKRWIKSLITSFVLTFIIIIGVDSIYLENNTGADMTLFVINVIMFSICFLPWFWLAPRITWTCRQWPCKLVFHQTNRSLVLWQIAFFICVFATYLFPLLLSIGSI